MHRHAEEQVVRQLVAVVEPGHPAVSGPARTTRRPGCHPMPRSSNAARITSDACGDGGIGVGSGITSDDLRRARAARARARKSCISSAVSLGAGGHLNGVDVTPTTTRPPSNRVQDVARRERAGDRVELVPALDQAGRGRRVEVGTERHHQDVRVERAGVRASPAWPTGSMARTVVRTKRDARVARGRRTRCSTCVARSSGRTSRRAWRSRRRTTLPGRPAARRRPGRSRPTAGSPARARRSRRRGPPPSWAPA